MGCGSSTDTCSAKNKRSSASLPTEGKGEATNPMVSPLAAAPPPVVSVKPRQAIWRAPANTSGNAERGPSSNSERFSTVKFVQDAIARGGSSRGSQVQFKRLSVHNTLGSPTTSTSHAAGRSVEVSTVGGLGSSVAPETRNQSLTGDGDDESVSFLSPDSADLAAMPLTEDNVSRVSEATAAAIDYTRPTEIIDWIGKLELPQPEKVEKEESDMAEDSPGHPDTTLSENPPTQPLTMTEFMRFSATDDSTEEAQEPQDNPVNAEEPSF